MWKSWGELRGNEAKLQVPTVGTKQWSLRTCTWAVDTSCVESLIFLSVSCAIQGAETAKDICIKCYHWYIFIYLKIYIFVNIYTHVFVKEILQSSHMYSAIILWFQALVTKCGLEILTQKFQKHMTRQFYGKHPWVRWGNLTSHSVFLCDSNLCLPRKGAL